MLNDNEIKKINLYKKRREFVEINYAMTNRSKVIENRTKKVLLQPSTKSQYLPIKIKSSLPIVQSKQTVKKSYIKKFFAYLLSFFSGVVNGLFGGGAGMFIVPLLEKMFGIQTKKAHATAVFIVLPLCVFSLILYVVQKKFIFENGLPICVGVVIGGVVGALLLKKINSKYLQYGFAFLVLFAGLKMLYDCIFTII